MSFNVIGKDLERLAESIQKLLKTLEADREEAKDREARFHSKIHDVRTKVHELSETLNMVRTEAASQQKLLVSISGDLKSRSQKQNTTENQQTHSSITGQKQTD